MRIKKYGLLAAVSAAAVLACTGCSRSVLNYQVAECIGTLDMYENNEPVETPKMKAEREQAEADAALEAQKTAVLDQAAALALEYKYEEAIALLQGAQELQDNEAALEAIAEYQGQLDGMYAYDGDIPHFSFTNLVVDTERAFDGDEYAQVYRETMITLSEFEAILDELYKKGYILIDMHSLANESGEDSSLALTEVNPVIPEGKKPFVLSIENLNYSTMRNGDGVATRLALDDQGEVAAVYTDEGGHELLGAYDVVPVLEQFIEEHPDFSYRGARGIISLSGVSGVFGYQIEEGTSPNYESNLETAKQIADRLKEDGWTFAATGYSYSKLRDMSYDTLKEDITKWQTVVGEVVGETDTLMYPYGAEVDYTTEKGAFVTSRFPYLIGLWSEGDHREVNGTYMRQTRRAVTGYILEYYPNNFEAYFTASVISDPAR